MADNTQIDSDLDVLSHPQLNHANRKADFDAQAERLYDLLLAPLRDHCADRRLLIAPYGMLHQLPFHLLRDSQRQQYLIELGEVVILPTASPGVTSPPVSGGATILYDDFGGTLRYARRDAGRLHQLLGGQLIDAAVIAPENALLQHSGAILHVVTHGYFDPVHPSLSYLQFRDSQVMAVDLPEYGLDGTLVTLTSCNTGQLWHYGRGRAAGDDQIGLGRMFLHAGARALVTSQWEIGDGLTLSLLGRFYERLLAGEAASAALRGAQLDLLDVLPNLHPVFWGAYQLVGSYAPVRIITDNDKGEVS